MDQILLTGGSGTLGSHILGLGKLEKVLAPSHSELDICNQDAVSTYFNHNCVDAVIHCAAVSRIAPAKKDPPKAIETNVVGTSNLIVEALRTEERSGKAIRFLYISTDGVYPGIRGNYSETDSPQPYSPYGWTKLGGECTVKVLRNHCIIRTSFFDPSEISFEYAPVNAYTSKLPVEEVAESVIYLLNSDFKGIVNVGGERKNYFDLHRNFNSLIKPCNLKDLPDGPVRDSSMDIKLWKKLKEKK